MVDHTRVCIVSNSDPVELVPGGIDSFIRGIFQYAPKDISFSLLGVSTNVVRRPVRQWTRCDVAGTPVEFFPVLGLDSVGRQRKIPVSLRFVLSLLRKRPSIATDVLEFHRFELMLPFLKHPAAKTAFVHQNMNVIKGGASDIRWKYLPKLYFWLEDRVIPKLNSLYTVREDAAEDYQRRYADLAEHIRFCPTWYDPAKFSSIEGDARRTAGRELRREFGFPDDTQVIISVGRLDHQKDPGLLLDGFNRLQLSMPRARLVYVGDGVLRGDLESTIGSLGLSDRVVLAGLRKPKQIAEFLNGADVFCLSSVYEGMPISLLEALACGTPVVSTDAGEAKRVVQDGNGVLLDDRKADTLARGLESVLRATWSQRRRSVLPFKEFTPTKGLRAHL